MFVRLKKGTLFIILKNYQNHNVFIFLSLKTTLLKWRPDFEVAADEYTQAGT